MSLRQMLREDLLAARAQDPAARNNLEVALAYSGVHAIWAYRIAHEMWVRPPFRPAARVLSQLARFFTGVEIHPGARIGRRPFIDHGSEIVIGETTVMGDDVMMYQGATIGGRTLQVPFDRSARRHAVIGNRVMLGAGCRIIGPISIGDDSAIGANAVVVRDVPADSIAIGMPAVHRHKDSDYPLDPRTDLIDPAVLL
ncbi:serine O-acetyltransferase [Zhihengliuella somnathii]